MKLTNKTGVHKVFESAVKNDTYTRGGADYSVTDIVGAPQRILLERRHDSEIEIDVADRAYALLGTALHVVLERGDKHEALTEERIHAEVNGVKLSGQVDRYEAGGIAADYKCTGVLAFKLGEKIEWEQQVNAYAWLFRSAGFKVKRLEIHAILRDWMISKAEIDLEYPASPLLSVELPLWSLGVADAYIAGRITIFKDAEKLPDGKLPPCTDAERWQRPTKYAVIKRGNKKATKLCDTTDEASEYMTEHDFQVPEYIIEYRPGTYERCRDRHIPDRTINGVFIPGRTVRYCNAAPFCKQWQDELKAVEDVY